MTTSEPLFWIDAVVQLKASVLSYRLSLKSLNIYYSPLYLLLAIYVGV